MNSTDTQEIARQDEINVLTRHMASCYDLIERLEKVLSRCTGNDHATQIERLKLLEKAKDFISQK